MRYNIGFKKAQVRRILLPDGPSVADISKETGITLQTLYKWVRDLKESVEMSDYKKTPDDCTLPEKNEAILEYFSLSPEEQGEWLRRKGLHSEHMDLWKVEIQKALSLLNTNDKAVQKELKQENKELKKELRLQEKAIARMSVQLALKKKLPYLFEDEEQ